MELKINKPTIRKGVKMEKKCLRDLKIMERVMWITTMAILTINAYSLVVSVVSSLITIYLLGSSYIYVTKEYGIIRFFENKNVYLLLSGVVSSIVIIILSL